MDITNFVSWFIDQVVIIFTKCFFILDSITFFGTSLLRLFTTIIIFSALIPVILTIGQSANVIGSRSERILEKKERARDRAKKE